MANYLRKEKRAVTKVAPRKAPVKAKTPPAPEPAPLVGLRGLFARWFKR